MNSFPSWFPMCLVVVLLVTQTSRAHRTIASVVDVPEVVGGPTCCLFDTMFSGTRAGGVVSYTANQEVFVWSIGDISNTSSILKQPRPTGLGPNPSPASYSHCGKWLNAVWADPEVATTVHAYFHQEWNCNYSDNGFTNKSIGYAVSHDGGLTFSPAADDGNGDQIIAAANFSTLHQTGEGDHDVVRVGDYLYAFFLEWDGYQGGVTIGVARSSVADKGRPGSWWKWFDGAFTQPGVGGNVDLVRNMSGTAVVYVDGLDALVSIGFLFSPGPLQYSMLRLARGTNATTAPPPVTGWEPSCSGPLFTAAYSDWNRKPSSAEFFGYPSLIGPEGNDRPIASNNSYVYTTYLAPGAGFADRYLIRRHLRFFELVRNNGTSPAAACTLLPSLAALTSWCIDGCCQTRGSWSTTGPVLGYNWSLAMGLYQVEVSPLAYLFTTDSIATGRTQQLQRPQQRGDRPATSSNHGGSDTVLLVDCINGTQQESPLTSVPVLTLDSECGAPDGPFASSVILRSSGWVATTLATALSLDWVIGVQQPSEGRVYRSTVIQVCRCVSNAEPRRYLITTTSANVTTPLCACPPAFVVDTSLGFALGPLTSQT